MEKAAGDGDAYSTHFDLAQEYVRDLTLRLFAPNLPCRDPTA